MSLNFTRKAIFFALNKLSENTREITCWHVTKFKNSDFTLYDTCYVLFSTIISYFCIITVFKVNEGWKWMLLPVYDLKCHSSKLDAL